MMRRVYDRHRAAAVSAKTAPIDFLPVPPRRRLATECVSRPTYTHTTTHLKLA